MDGYETDDNHDDEESSDETSASCDCTSPEEEVWDGNNLIIMDCFEADVDHPVDEEDITVITEDERDEPNE